MSDNLLCMEVTENVKTVRVNPRRKSRVINSAPQLQGPQQPPSTAVQLKPLYLKRLPISEAKKKDLLALCDKQIIPEEYHGWYSSLPTHTGADRLPGPSVDEESSQE